MRRRACGVSPAPRTQLFPWVVSTLAFTLTSTPPPRLPCANRVQLQVTMLRLGNTKLPKTRPHPPDLPDDLAFAHGDLNDATSA